MGHEEVWIKVNAKVDRGIAPLVQAVNALPDVLTVESCEGDDEHEAYVAFFVGDNDWQTVGRVANLLSLELGRDETVADVPFRVSVEWYSCGGTPTGYVRVPRRDITTLSRSLQSAASRLSQLPAP